MSGQRVPGHHGASPGADGAGDHGQARLGANQGYGFGGNPPGAGTYGGGSGLGYGGFGPYGQAYRGQNFGLGYGHGTVRAQPPLPAGPHVGKGPRNYQRTDDELVDAIVHRLTQDGLDSRRIDVTAHNHEVTLSGTVDSRRQKRHAEDIAESVGGVVDVHNRLRIAGAGQS